MNDFKKLTVWNNSIDLVTDLYKLTEKFPKTEVYGLTNQVRRSAISISSNIAEGAGRATRKEFRLFLNYAYGSCCELETQLIIANKLNFMPDDLLKESNGKLEKIEKMLYNLMQSLNH
jgi:four helix bundle protein